MNPHRAMIQCRTESRNAFQVALKEAHQPLNKHHCPPCLAVPLNLFQAQSKLSREPLVCLQWTKFARCTIGLFGSDFGQMLVFGQGFEVLAANLLVAADAADRSDLAHLGRQLQRRLNCAK